MALTSSEKTARYRETMRAASLRPIQVRVPDTRSKTLAEEARRQSLLVASDPHEVEILDWIESIADTEGWE